MSNKKQTKKENIFDLSKIVSNTNDIEISGDEVSESSLLVGYEPVDPKEWANLSPRTHIRYLNKDGTMRRGGFVSKIWSKKDLKGNAYILIDLVANYGKNSSKWSISSTKVEKIWRKEGSDYEDVTVNSVPTAAKGVDSQVLKDLGDDIEYCKKSIQHITIEIQKIKNEQTRTLELIKKLHNIR